MKIFDEGFYFATFDLKSGYHHIKIHEKDIGYLGFSWDFGGRTRYFVFIVMPFGLSPASYVFTKVLRPFIKKWRGEGIRCIIYVDDGIHGAAGKRETAYNCLKIREDLELAGFTLNEEKSCMYPSQTGRWLGFNIDSVHLMLSVPDEKLEKLLAISKEATTEVHHRPKNFKNCRPNYFNGSRFRSSIQAFNAKNVCPNRRSFVG